MNGTKFLDILKLTFATYFGTKITHLFYPGVHVCANLLPALCELIYINTDEMPVLYFKDYEMVLEMAIKGLHNSLKKKTYIRF